MTRPRRTNIDENEGESPSLLCHCCVAIFVLCDGMLLRFVVCYLFGVGLVVSLQAAEPQHLASELTTRYAPYADWQSVVDVEVLAKQPLSRYWRTPQEIISQREEGGGLPLTGLHLALDPGHIGGRWAAAEGRQFRIREEDFYVREGELVLEVAQLVRAELVALGAEVSLLREANVRVNPKNPVDYLEMAAEQLSSPDSMTAEALWAYGDVLRGRAVRLSIISGDLAERARLVNEVIQPDALISLHINAAAWPAPAASESESESESEGEGEGGEPKLRLVETNNLHALIFGCMSAGELQSGRQQEQLTMKLTNESGAAERLLGGALAAALAEATQLPPATYQGTNAILLSSEDPYLYARNLLMLRVAECPTVLLEPYVANSVEAYARFQSALATRAAGLPLGEDDILLEYVDAVVAGVLACYGSALPSVMTEAAGWR